MRPTDEAWATSEDFPNTTDVSSTDARIREELSEILAAACAWRRGLAEPPSMRRSLSLRHVR
jgi:hypothetical protein